MPKIPEFILQEMVWSFSRLNSWYQCKWQWYLQYIKKVKSEQNAFAEYGTLMHETLEKFSKGDLLGFMLADYFEDNFNDVIMHDFPPNRYVNLRESYFNKGLDYLQNFEGFNTYKEIVGVEKEVNFKINDYSFIGYIDLLVRDKDDHLQVIDHKSHNLKPRSNRKKATKGDLELDNYLKQLYLYSIPLLPEYGELPTYLNFNVFRDQLWIHEPFKKEKFKESKQWALDTIEEIKSAETFPASYDDFFCNQLCNFRKICGVKFARDRDKINKKRR